jgi:hypothetical protein
LIIGAGYVHSRSEKYMHVGIKETAVHINGSRVQTPHPSRHCLLLNNISIFLRQIIIYDTKLPLVRVVG